MILVLLPLALLLLDPLWMYAGPRRDPWLYYGYFRNLRLLLETDPLAYYASRLSVLLPGAALHALLPALTAHTLLHLVLFWVAVLGFYRLVRELHGPRAALLAAVGLGCHPFFLVAAGRDYVDGFGLVYLVVALLAVTRAARSRREGSWMALAGASALALVSANLFFAVFLPFLLLQYLVLRARPGSSGALAAGAAAGAGAVASAIGLGILSKAFGGLFFFLSPTFEWLRGQAGKENPFRVAAREWLSGAGWLVIPAAVFLVALFELLRTLPRSPLDPSRLGMVQAVLFGGLMLIIQLVQAPVLQYFFYASLLLPFTFLALAGWLERPLETLSRRAFIRVSAVWTILLVAPAAVWNRPAPAVPAPRAAAPILIALALSLAGVALIRLPFRRAVSLALAAACLGGGAGLSHQLAAIDREFDPLSPDRREVFLRLEATIRFLKWHLPAGDFVFWFDRREPAGVLYDPIATTYLLCRRLLNMDFPRLPEPRTCDGRPLTPGMKIVLLSQREGDLLEAHEALRPGGFSFRVVARETMVGVPSFAVSILELTDGSSP